jgi:hypothetical protein
MNGGKSYVGRTRADLLMALFLLAIAASIGTVLYVQAYNEQFTAMGPGADIRSLAVSPGWATDETFFSGASTNLIWVTRNAGGEWAFTSTGWSSAVSALALSPGFGSDATAFAGSADGFARTVISRFLTILPMIRPYLWPPITASTRAPMRGLRSRP